MKFVGAQIVLQGLLHQLSSFLKQEQYQILKAKNKIKVFWAEKDRTLDCKSYYYPKFKLDFPFADLKSLCIFKNQSLLVHTCNNGDT